jgi:hypothetical protein
MSDGSLVLAVTAWACGSAICVSAHLFDPALEAALPAVGIDVVSTKFGGRTVGCTSSSDTL